MKVSLFLKSSQKNIREYILLYIATFFWWMSTYPGDGTLLAASTAASNVRTNYCYYYLYSNTVQYINDSFDICIPGESEFSEEL